MGQITVSTAYNAVMWSAMGKS